MEWEGKRVVVEDGLSDEGVVEYCINKLRESGDGGEADLDKKVAESVTITELPPSTTGFAEWERDGAKRGVADWVEPANADLSSRILFLHGGGFVWYSPQDVYRPLSSRIAAKCGMPVLAIDYRKAPEHQFPGGVEDAVTALQWLSENTPHGKDKASHLFVVGDSAGGCLVLSLALIIRERFSNLGLNITACVAISPYVDFTSSGESYRTRMWNGESKEGDPIFSDGNDEEKIRESSLVSIKKYLGETPKDHPIASPVFAPTELMAQLPPTLIAVGDAEVMLDDSQMLYDNAKKAGAPVSLLVYPRMWHVWVMYAEGCGGDKPLKQAEHGLDQIAGFFASKVGK